MQCVDLGGPRKIKKKNFFQAEDGIRDVERSRGLGDVYKRQAGTYCFKIAGNQQCFTTCTSEILVHAFPMMVK